MVDKQKVEQAIRLLLEGIGEDTEREGLKDTPDRIARMCMEIYGGLDEEADHHLAKQFEVENNEMVLEKEPDAIIVEGFGRGNLPAGMMPAIKKAVKKGIFVVISTRASSGRVLDSTVFPGSVAQCLESGCLLAGETTTAKARLLLMYVLSQKEAIQLKKEDPERFFAYVQECLDPVLTNRLFG